MQTRGKRSDFKFLSFILYIFYWNLPSFPFAGSKTECEWHSLLKPIPLSQSVKDKAGVRRLWISKSQGIGLFEWSPGTVHDLHLWHLVQQGSQGFHWVESRGITSKDCFLSLLETPLHSIISASSLHCSLKPDVVRYKVLWTISGSLPSPES